MHWFEICIVFHENYVTYFGEAWLLNEVYECFSQTVKTSHKIFISNHFMCKYWVLRVTYYRYCACIGDIFELFWELEKFGNFSDEGCWIYVDKYKCCWCTQHKSRLHFVFSSRGVSMTWPLNISFCRNWAFNYCLCTVVFFLMLIIISL